MDFQTLSDPKVAIPVLSQPAYALSPELSPGVYTVTENFTAAFGNDLMRLLGFTKESPQLCIYGNAFSGYLISFESFPTHSQLGCSVKESKLLPQLGLWPAFLTKLNHVWILKMQKTQLFT